ncbi:MAG: class I SAM-dependent methyltransferase [Planctomycetota bacterium]|nr:class I SAM-dependent methyltransferase [Planctomycetota bacterium]
MASHATLSASQPLLEQVRQHRRAVYAAACLTGRKGTRYDLWPIGVQESAGEFLRDVVIRERAKRTLEIGLGLGLSALSIAEALLTGRLAGGVSHTIVEPDPGLLEWAGFDQYCASGAMAFTTVVQEDSRLAMPRMVANGDEFDFVYVDGGHWYDFVFLDIHYALRLIRPGGLIVVDDHWMQSVQMALAFFHANGLGELELYDPQGPGKRFVGVRKPMVEQHRTWDHFEPFGRHTLPEYPWRPPPPRPLSSVDEPRSGTS